MAGKAKLILTTGWQPESILPSETTASNWVRQGSDHAGYNEVLYDRVLQRDAIVKEEFQAEEYHSVKADETHSGVSRYQYFSGDHVPRYIPLPSYGSNKLIESSSSSPKEDNSSYYTCKPSTFSRGPEYFSSPPSTGILAPKSRGKDAEDKPEYQTRPESKKESLLATEKTNVLSTSTLVESDITTYRDEVLQSAFGSLPRDRVPMENTISATHVNILHEGRSSNRTENSEPRRELTKPASKLLISTPYELSRLVSFDITETSEESPVSDTEFDSEGEWLSGRYIPGFFRDKWLNGTAVEIPTTEACALAIVREALVDQIMTELPDFDPTKTTNFTSNTGSSSDQSPSNKASKSTQQPTADSSFLKHGHKRSLDNDEDESPLGGDDGPPDPLRPRLGASQSRESSLRLACPFRKHEREKYNPSEYRVCATTPWDSIGRLKQHLIRTHRAVIFCPKCKNLFKTLEDMYLHLAVPDSRSCKFQDSPEPAGVTPVMEEKLQGRWKGFTAEAFWGRMYQILFPNETVPSPYFEEVVDTPPAKERPTRQEFHRLVRARLGDSFDKEIERLQERTKSKVAEIVEDCYEEMNSGCNRSGEAGREECTMNDMHNQELDKLTLQGFSEQQPNFDATESSSSPVFGEENWTDEQAQFEISTLPLQFPSTPTHNQQHPPVGSRFSPCLCFEPCTCLAPISFESAMQKLDVEVLPSHASEYKAFWNGGPTDVATFDSYVYGD